MSSSKGTVTYFSDIILALTSMIGVFAALAVAFLVVFISKANLEGTVTGEILYQSPLAESSLMAFSEVTVDGTRLRDIISYAAFSEAGDVSNIYFKGKIYDLKKLSQDTMDGIYGSPYLLALMMTSSSQPIILASSQSVSKSPKAFRLYLNRGNSYIELFTG